METEKCVYRFGGAADGVDVTEGDASMNFVFGGKGLILPRWRAWVCPFLLALPSLAKHAWDMRIMAMNGSRACLTR